MLQGGPADKAGIKPGDILMNINDDAITDTTRLLNVVAQIKPGTSVKVHLMRKSKELDVNVVIGKRPMQPKSPQSPDDEGGDQGGDQGDE
ncbi:2-alkenal reductase [Caballeronia sordidicola]|uniref:2-alkenal reductase n=1 Tax=Caballeronia sordidicola TaxID=196367 RepID=A0A158I073_CABSO|nr:2-alkenal reductase [Caballeronia sordidicola]